VSGGTRVIFVTHCHLSSVVTRTSKRFECRGTSLRQLSVHALRGRYTCVEIDIGSDDVTVRVALQT